MSKSSKIIAIWAGTVIGEHEHQDFRDHFNEAFGIEVGAIEQVTTLPSKDENGDDIEDTGGRRDIIFEVSPDSAPAFIQLSMSLEGLAPFEAVASIVKSYYPEEVYARYAE